MAKKKAGAKMKKPSLSVIRGREAKPEMTKKKKKATVTSSRG